MAERLHNEPEWISYQPVTSSLRLTGATTRTLCGAGQTILLLLGVVPAFSWLSGRVSRIRQMTTMQIIFIGCIAGFYVVAQAKAPIGLAFYLWLGIFNVFANDIYGARRACR